MEHGGARISNMETNGQQLSISGVVSKTNLSSASVKRGGQSIIKKCDFTRANLIVVVILAGLGASIFGAGTFTALAQPVTEINSAASNPDKFAWDLFVALNAPALKGQRGIPDKNKSYGDRGLRVRETWKVTSGTNNEVFLAEGKEPGKWDMDSDNIPKMNPGPTEA